MAAGAGKTWGKRLVGGLLAIGGIVFVPDLIKQWDLRQHYIEHLFIVQHDYVYRVTIATGDKTVSLYLVKNAGNQFDTWEPGASVNRINAAAFLAENDGVGVTSRFATEPWKNAADESAIKSLVSKQTGLATDRIAVSGVTVRLTMQSALLAAKSGGHELDAVVLAPTDFGKEVRFIGRANNAAPLPLERVPLGSTYVNNLEKGKPLYAVGYPNIDLSSGLPFDLQVTKLVVEHYDSFERTSFEKTSAWLPEGAPVFDRSLNLVGVYTSASSTNEPSHISNLLRHLDGALPSVRGGLQKQVDSIPELPSGL